MSNKDNIMERRENIVRDISNKMIIFNTSVLTNTVKNIKNTADKKYEKVRIIESVFGYPIEDFVELVRAGCVEIDLHKWTGCPKELLEIVRRREK